MLDEVAREGFVRKPSFLVSGVSAHFISRGTNCPLVSHSLFQDVCTASRAALEDRDSAPSLAEGRFAAVHYMRLGCSKPDIRQL